MQVIEIEQNGPVNPYAGDIAQLAEMRESNPKAAGEWIVDTKDASKTRFKIGKAANDIDLTAALVTEEELTGKDKDKTRLVFRLKARHQSKPRGPRKPKAESVTETVEATTE